MIHPWHQTAWRQLTADTARTAHAYLITGRKHTGKTDFARHFAQSLLCENTPADNGFCGRCPSCHLFAQNSHPDFYTLTPEDTADNDNARKQAAIKIDDVRKVLTALTQTSLRGGRRVVLITPAENMNRQAANALLKMLEEPPAAAVFLLVAHNKDRLLPTVKSRCRPLPLPAPDAAEAAAHLHRRHPELTAQQADALCAFHGHTPLCTPAPEEDTARENLCRLLAQPRLLAILDYAAEFDRRKYPLSHLLEWLGKWLTDLALVRHGLPPRYYPAHRETLGQTAQRTRSDTLFALDNRIRSLHPYGRHSLNVRMQAESLLTEYLTFWQNKESTP